MNRSRQVPADETPAFGGIAERFRRAGDLERAVALCRDGLKKFPDHLSARVTLGWSLLDLGRYDEAQVELEQVLKRAPDNLAAIRGLAELHERAENAVTVPIEDHDAAEAAAALEAAHALEAEPEPAKKTKAHHHEPAPEPPATSVFAEPMRAPEPAPARVAPEPTPEPTLEELSAQFAAAEPESGPAHEVAQVPDPPLAPPVELPGPVPVLDARGEVIPELAFSPAPEAVAPEPVAPEPVIDDLPTLVEDLLTPAQAAMHAPEPTPEPIVDAVLDAVVDVPVEPEVALVDFSVEPTAADTDALLAEAALLSAPEPEPVAAPIPVEDVEIPAAMFDTEPVAEADLHPHPELTDAASAAHDPIADPAHASMMAAEHLATTHEAHPEPDVTELLAQLAQDADAETAAPIATAEPVIPDVHPQPDISEVASQFAHEAAEPVPAAPVETFESEPAWNAATPDFVAAMETAAAEPAVMHEPESAGTEAFALSAELAPAAPLEDFALMSTPFAVVETAADQRALDLADVTPAEATTPHVGVAQVLNFETPPPAPSAPAVPQPPAPAPTPSPIFARVAAPPVAAPVVPPPAPVRAKAKPAKSVKTVAALERMLRGIESRRAQIASEYRPS